MIDWYPMKVKLTAQYKRSGRGYLYLILKRGHPDIIAFLAHKLGITCAKCNEEKLVQECIRSEKENLFIGRSCRDSNPHGVELFVVNLSNLFIFFPEDRKKKVLGIVNAIFEFTPLAPRIIRN